MVEQTVEEEEPEPEPDNGPQPLPQPLSLPYPYPYLVVSLICRIVNLITTLLLVNVNMPYRAIPYIIHIADELFAEEDLPAYMRGKNIVFGPQKGQGGR